MISGSLYIFGTIRNCTYIAILHLPLFGHMHSSKLLSKTWILFSSLLLIAQVSHPRSSTDLVNVVYGLILVLMMVEWTSVVF
jgi:hypothetical protein